MRSGFSCRLAVLPSRRLVVSPSASRPRRRVAVSLAAKIGHEHARLSRLARRTRSALLITERGSGAKPGPLQGHGADWCWARAAGLFAGTGKVGEGAVADIGTLTFPRHRYPTPGSTRVNGDKAARGVATATFAPAAVLMTVSTPIVLVVARMVMIVVAPPMPVAIIAAGTGAGPSSQGALALTQQRGQHAGERNDRQESNGSAARSRREGLCQMVEVT